MNLIEGITFILLKIVQGAVLAEQVAEQVEDPAVDLEAGLAVDHVADLVADQTVGILEDRIN